MSEESEKLKYLRVTVQSYEEQLEKMRHDRKVLDGRIDAIEALLKSAKKLLKTEMEKSGISLEKVAEAVKTGKYAKMTLKEAIYSVLSEARRPMHVDQVLEELEKGGAELKAKDPRLSIASTLHRDNERYRKTGPNTFELRSEALNISQMPL